MAVTAQKSYRHVFYTVDHFLSRKAKPMRGDNTVGVSKMCKPKLHSTLRWKTHADVLSYCFVMSTAIRQFKKKVWVTTAKVYLTFSKVEGLQTVFI